MKTTLTGSCMSCASTPVTLCESHGHMSLDGNGQLMFACPASAQHPHQGILHLLLDRLQHCLQGSTLPTSSLQLLPRPQ